MGRVSINQERVHLGHSTEVAIATDITSGKQIQKTAKKLFLANEKNKSQFLMGVRKRLEDSRVKVVQRPADANLLLAQIAIQCA